MTAPFGNDSTAGPRLRRSLSLWDLIVYGVIIVCPLSPAPFFGILTQKGHGHAATTILIAMFAMLPTAISYGRMARIYPSAGSAFTYVGREIGAGVGYITGWGMMMDYLLNTLIVIIWVGQQTHVFFPVLPYWVCAVLVAALSTALTSQGIRMSARANLVMGAALGAVVLVFLGAAAVYVANHPHGAPGFFTHPFYDPKTWRWQSILGGTSLAMLTYIGFDGISTLSEECANPRRNIMIATVLTCVVVAVLSVLEVYAAQLVWPSSEAFPNLDTAFTFAAQRAWAPLFAVVGVAIIGALLAVGIADQLAVARLLYGMGRSGALPRRFFGAIHPRSQVPLNNVLFVGCFALGGALLLPAISGEATGYELGANLVNFGALISFMGVNAAAFMRYYVRAQKKRLVNLLLPAVGFFVCLTLWWNLGTRAIQFGVVWMALGIAFGAWRSRGFRDKIAVFQSASESETDESGSDASAEALSSPLSTTPGPRNP
jgi:putrescine importer